MVTIDFYLLKMKISEILENSIVKSVLRFLLVVLSLSLIHWGLIYMYNKMCIDLSVFGFITHTFNMSSPFCQLINLTQYSISNHFVNILVTSGGLLVTYLCGRFVVS